jgi:uncharacterized membrane protein
MGTTSSLGRWRRHILTDQAHVRRAFPPAALARIEETIAAGERKHSGQVVIAVEPALPLARVTRAFNPRDRALEVFGLLRVWDTEHNNGVLLYVLLADHHFEIIADRGIHRKVGDAGWQAICTRMETAFRARHYADGVVQGIADINALLIREFPHDGSTRNELPDKPVLL